MRLYSIAIAKAEMKEIEKEEKFKAEDRVELRQLKQVLKKASFPDCLRDIRANGYQSYKMAIRDNFEGIKRVITNAGGMKSYTFGLGQKKERVKQYVIIDEERIAEGAVAVTIPSDAEGIAKTPHLKYEINKQIIYPEYLRYQILLSEELQEQIKNCYNVVDGKKVFDEEKFLTIDINTPFNPVHQSNFLNNIDPKIFEYQNPVNAAYLNKPDNNYINYIYHNSKFDIFLKNRYQIKILKSCIKTLTGITENILGIALSKYLHELCEKNEELNYLRKGEWGKNN